MSASGASVSARGECESARCSTSTRGEYEYDGECEYECECEYEGGCEGVSTRVGEYEGG